MLITMLTYVAIIISPAVNDVILPVYVLLFLNDSTLLKQHPQLPLEGLELQSQREIKELEKGNKSHALHGSIRYIFSCVCFY